MYFIVKTIKGVVCVADDIVVIGRGLTDAEGMSSHISIMKALLNRCGELNIRENAVVPEVYQIS